jgi:hypothetical protein
VSGAQALDVQREARERVGGVAVGTWRARRRPGEAGARVAVAGAGPLAGGRGGRAGSSSSQAGRHELRAAVPQRVDVHSRRLAWPGGCREALDAAGLRRAGRAVRRGPAAVGPAALGALATPRGVPASAARVPDSASPRAATPRRAPARARARRARRRRRNRPASGDSKRSAHAPIWSNSARFAGILRVGRCRPVP